LDGNEMAGMEVLRISVLAIYFMGVFKE